MSRDRSPRQSGRTLRETESAVSEVTSVATLVALAVVLVVALGTNVLFLDTGASEAPDASFSFTYFGSTSSLAIRYQSGEPIPAERLLIRGPDAQVTWAELNPNVNKTTQVREGDITRIARDTPYGAGVTGSEQIEIAWLGDPGNVSSATRLDTWNGTD